jgi:hypothetical protein
MCSVLIEVSDLTIPSITGLNTRSWRSCAFSVIISGSFLVETFVDGIVIKISFVS